MNLIKIAIRLQHPISFKISGNCNGLSLQCAYWGHCKKEDLQGVFVKIGDLIKFKGFLVEFLQNRRSSETQKTPEICQKSGFF